ncbi:MAG TPA: hypothetical protein VHW09_27045 [Bryobacteraceae bacterium]|nr:hypothetical protein [Bryobacteraceae bacterium]
MDAIESAGRSREGAESRAMAEAEDRSEARAHALSGLELVVSKAINPVQIFTANGLDPILDRIEKETRSIAVDISTAKGRDDLASLAYKIAKSKTALDKAGKDLVAGWKDQAKKVDLERARAWERLEALQKEIRQPLTDWENREKDRVAAHEARLAQIAQYVADVAVHWQTAPIEQINRRLREMLEDKTDWQEFSAKAKLVLEQATDSIAAAVVKRQKDDAEQAELARLRKEEEERKQREHEEKIARAAAEQARFLAEEEARKAAENEAARVAAEKAKAEAERQRLQREKDAAEAKAKREADEGAAREAKAKREKEEAEARAAQAEKDRVAAQAEAKENARIAAEKAATAQKAAEEAAAKRERDRIAAEKRAEAEAAAKREANEKHRAKINGEVVDGLLRAVIVSGEDEFAEVAEEALARRIVEAIAKGEIPHIRIQY